MFVHEPAIRQTALDLKRVRIYRRSVALMLEQVGRKR
jgi:hypothetical protein